VLASVPQKGEKEALDPPDILTLSRAGIEPHSQAGMSTQVLGSVPSPTIRHLGHYNIESHLQIPELLYSIRPLTSSCSEQE
jgi:hypothetical protein